MKRIRLILIGLVLVVLLSVGLIGGITLAQTTGTTGDSGNTLIARVATILGIDEAKVEAAFNQAQREMELEALDSRLKAMVDEGTITQAQADQYRTWWQSRPDMPAGIDLPAKDGFHGMRGLGGPGAMLSQESTTTGGSNSSTTPLDLN